MEEVKFRKLNIICIPLVFALFEAVTLFIIAVLENIGTPLAYNTVISGIVVGFFGTIAAMLVLNLALKKISFSYKNRRIERINILVPAIYNSFFLALLFTVESQLSFLKSFHVIYGNAVFGFITTGLSILITMLLYNLISKKCARFVFRTNRKFVVRRISPFTIAFFAGIYEFFALPLMAYLPDKNPFVLLGPVFGFSMVGLISGFLSGFIVVLIYNHSNIKISIAIE